MLKKFFSFINKHFIHILIPIITILISYFGYNIQNDVKYEKNLELFLKYSSEIEKSYRSIKNHFEEIETDNYHSQIIFRNKLTQLDYSMVDFYHKIIMLYTPRKESLKKNLDYFRNFYWGNDSLDSKYSFREFIKKSEYLSRKNRKIFLEFINDIKNILEFFDDLKHVIIINYSLSFHKEREKVIEIFENTHHSIEILEEDVENKKSLYIEQIKIIINDINSID